MINSVLGFFFPFRFCFLISFTIIAMVNGAKTQLCFFLTQKFLPECFNLVLCGCREPVFLFRLEEFQNQIKAQDYEENYHVFTA